MARYEVADGILAQGCAHSPGGAGGAYHVGEVAVGYQGAFGNRKESLPDLQLEVAAHQVEVQGFIALAQRCQGKSIHGIGA